MHKLYTQGIASRAAASLVSCSPKIVFEELSLTLVYLPFLDQFSAKERVQLTQEDEQWSWLIPEKILENRDSREYFSEWEAKQVKSALTRYLVLILPDHSAHNRMPVPPNLEFFRGPHEGVINQGGSLEEDDHRTFYPGYFKGWMQVVDQKEEAFLCESPIEVTSGASVAYKIIHRSRGNPPHTAIRNDFQKRFRSELAKNLPSSIIILL
ncbi:hypothetical protein [Desulfopila sp. IMCC35008]|uniref:hypothetical protein n=1 Tax=Desulfopila sp. IMCC35008 TaxID=2653858 RepID=UPI0013D84201|nr:hypothetical protein [Desulfopila sp. IMCC35008]